MVLAPASAMAVLILSPGSLTEPVALRELAIFAAALLVMVLANLSSPAASSPRSSRSCG